MQAFNPPLRRPSVHYVLVEYRFGDGERLKIGSVLQLLSTSFSHLIHLGVCMCVHVVKLTLET